MDFRDLFFACLEASYSQEELSRLLDSDSRHLLIYPPTPEMLEEPSATDWSSFLAAVDANDRNTRPFDLYRRGRDQPAAHLSHSQIETALRRHPLTIVVFPGIFGEFIDTRPFEEAFRTGGAFRAEWQASIESFRREHDSEETADVLFDSRFLLEEAGGNGGGEVRLPLADLLSAASLDDADGSPLVRLLLLRPGLLSLETLDDIPRLSEIARRRVAKAFRVLGVPQNLALLGYSMGAMIALDALSQASQENANWADSVRAVISVGGVLFGSHVADQATHPEPSEMDNPLHRQVTLLRELREKLREPDKAPMLKRPGIILTNTRAWLRFARAYAKVLRQVAAAGDELDLPRLRSIGKKADFQPTLQLVGRIAFDAFKLYNPFHYSRNVGKFQVLIRGALAAIENLSTEGRRRWWEANALPTAGVRYYAVAATMGTSDEETPAGPFLANTVTYNPGSLDYEFLCQGHRDFIAAHGVRLNDSQVAVGRARFWPRLAALSGSDGGKPLHAEFLGVLGTHHWGLVLEFANESRDDSVNPYPRLALLKALAAKAAFDLEAPG